MDAYRFLVKNYQKGDDVYLLGFSRGAHTVRVLAGFINLVGVLHSHQEHLSSYALTAYKQSSIKNQFDIAWRVQEVLDSHRIIIRFMGCWDTVASVIVPRPDRFYLPTLEALPFTKENPCVKVFRHAISIDERRRMFRLARWKEPQLFKINPFVKDDIAEQQDIKQVWFAGVHSDIGGGYPEPQSGAAKYPLRWMVDEAREHGLVFRETMVKRLVCGQNPKNVQKGSVRDYAKPSPDSTLHNSMNWAWKIAEYLPKQKKWHDHPETRKQSGFYLPRSERRFIPPDAEIHSSVDERIKVNADSNNYGPPNLP